MPRFVVLEHDHPHLHWDFMLEAGQSLLTWRIQAPPQPGRICPAEETFPHRRLYLDYEGPVSGGRGSVKRWDAGIFTWDLRGTTIAVVLKGRRLDGRAVLERNPAGDSWRFHKNGEPTRAESDKSGERKE